MYFDQTFGFPGEGPGLGLFGFLLWIDAWLSLLLLAFSLPAPFSARCCSMDFMAKALHHIMVFRLLL